MAISYSVFIANITERWKRAYNRLTLFPKMRRDLAIQIFKSFIRTKLKYGSIIWGGTIHNIKYLRLPEVAQEGALMLILKAMKFTPFETMEADLCIAPIDLRRQELQRNEDIKFFQKNDKYFSRNMLKKYAVINQHFYLI